MTTNIFDEMDDVARKMFLAEVITSVYELEDHIRELIKVCEAYRAEVMNGNRCVEMFGKEKFLEFRAVRSQAREKIESAQEYIDEMRAEGALSDVLVEFDKLILNVTSEDSGEEE